MCVSVQSQTRLNSIPGDDDEGDTDTPDLITVGTGADEHSTGTGTAQRFQSIDVVDGEPQVPSIDDPGPPPPNKPDEEDKVQDKLIEEVEKKEVDKAEDERESVVKQNHEKTADKVATSCDDVPNTG